MEFAQWAEARGFKIEWLTWARESKLLDRDTVGTRSRRRNGKPTDGQSQEKHWDAERLAELDAFRKANTAKATAKHYGISTERVRQLLRRYRESYVVRGKSTSRKPRGFWDTP